MNIAVSRAFGVLRMGVPRRAALDPSALEKAVAEGKLGPEVLERVKTYVSTEKRYTVTLKEESKE